MADIFKNARTYRRRRFDFPVIRKIVKFFINFFEYRRSESYAKNPPRAERLTAERATGLNIKSSGSITCTGGGDVVEQRLT